MCKEERTGGGERKWEEMPSCAAQEQSDQHSAKLQHVKFALSELQKELLFLQEYTALLQFFSSLGLQNLLLGPQATVSAAKAKPSSGGMLSEQESLQSAVTFQRKGEPTSSQLGYAFYPASYKYNFGP